MVSGLAVLEPLSRLPLVGPPRIGYCTSLATLRALPGRETRPPLVPSAFAALGPPEGQSRPSIIDSGLAVGGVLSGVLLGVEEALSTLAFLDPDRGVIFEFSNVFTGVATSSLDPATVALELPTCASFRSVGDGVEVRNGSSDDN